MGKIACQAQPTAAYKLITEANQVFSLTTYSKANMDAFGRIFQHNKAWFNFMINFIFDLYQESNNPQYLNDLMRLIEVNHQIAISDAYLTSEQPLMSVSKESQKIGQTLLEVKSKIAFLGENAAQFHDTIIKLRNLENELSIQWHQTLSSVESPTLYSTESSSIDLHDAKAWCASYSETIVSYYQADSAVFIAIINQDTTAVLKQQLSRHQLGLVIDSLSEGIVYFGTILLLSEEKIKEALALYNHTSYYLYRLLVRPSQKMLTKNVTIIPDGIIFNVPFSCLTIKEHDQASWTAESFLANTYNLTFNYSLQSITQAKPSMIDEPVIFIAPFRSKASSTPALYLPASDQEYQKVAEVLKINAVDPYSTKSDIKSFFKNNAIIHLATHAFSESSKPAGYYLCINQNPEAFTGRLYLHEIYGATFEAGLLVLNACQTAKTSDASLSLSRAFYSAGAKHLISTQWKIADETNLDITGHIYQRLAVSDHVGECLGGVKRNYLQNHSGIRLHPYYWDGHQAWVSGSVKLLPSMLGFTWQSWVLGMLLLLVLSWVFYKKKRVVQ